MPPDSEGWERFHPLTPLFSAWRLAALGLVVGAQQVPSAVTETPPPVVAAVSLIFLAGAGGYGYLAWRHARYRLSGGQLEIQRGILFRSRGHVPIARIESVDIAQRAVPRVLGLAEVVVEVASQSGGEAELKYLSLDGAHDLQRRLDEARHGRAIDAVDASPAVRVPIAVVTDRDLLLAYGSGPAAGAVGVLAVSAVAVAVGGIEALLAFGVLGFIGVAAAVGSQLRELDRLHGFAISRVDDELHITRGFVEKLTQQIPLARIQAIRIDEPWIWRRFDRARLKVVVAGYRGSERARSEASAILMPVARRAAIDQLVAILGGPTLTDVARTAPPPAARWRAPLRWQHTWIGHTPGFTVVHRGWLGRTTDFVTAPKLQSLRLSSGPWQRRLGLASLHLDTAGTGIRVIAAHLTEADAAHALWTSRDGTANP